MKKWINYTLLILTIVCLVVALKLSSLPPLNFLPTNISNWFHCSSDTQEKYSFFYDIAMGFILSALFYFIVDAIPEKIKIHRAKKLLSQEINQLLEHMEQIISIIIALYNRNPKLKELSEKDFLILNGETKQSNQEISYLTTLYDTRSKRKKSAIRQPTTLNDLIKNNFKKISKCLSIIKNYEYFYSTHVELMECIRSIENCQLIDCYTRNVPCFRYHTTHHAISNFISLYLKLKSLKFHSQYYITTLDSPEETLKYRKEREDGSIINRVFACQQKQFEQAQINPTIVLTSSKYTSTIITSELATTFQATYINLSQSTSDLLINYKNIVIICDSTTKTRLARICSLLPTSAKIILLSEINIFKKSYKKTFKYSSNNIEEIFFKSCSNRFGITLNKKEPSEKSIRAISNKLNNLCFEISTFPSIN